MERPDLRPKVLALVERNFPRGSELSRPVPLDQEFRLLLDPDNAAHTLFFTDEGEQPCASASYRLFDLRIPGASTPLRVAGVGLVVTDPAHRGHGLSAELQREIEKRALKEGAALCSLWSDLFDFYAKLGYIVAGSELQWVLDQDALELFKGRLQTEKGAFKNDLQVRPIESFRETNTLYENLATGPLRPAAALYDDLARLSDTHVLGAYRQQELVAYACVGKGRDLRDTLHELVGEPRAVGPLLAALAPLLQKSLRVHQPLGSPLEEELTHWLGAGERTAFAFLKPIDPAALVKWLNLSGCLPRGVQLRWSDKPVARFEALAQGKSFFESDDPGHLVQLFLGPWLPSEMSDLPPLLTQKLGDLKLPPLYFWGFDSV